MTTFSGGLDPLIAREMLFKKKCTTWSVKEVCSFLEYLRFPDDLVKEFKNNKVIGFHLLVINNDILKNDLKMKKLKNRLHLLSILDKIKRHDHYFHPDWQITGVVRRDLETGCLAEPFARTYHMISDEEKFQIVKEKVLNKIGGSRPRGVSETEFDEYCRNLMTKKLLIENYLNKNFDGIRKLLQAMPKNKSNFFSSTWTNLEDEVVFTEDVNEVSADTVEVLENTERVKKQYNINKKNRISVKLVITEIAQQDKKRMFRKIVSPIMFGFRTQQEFGWFHSAVIVGPWYLEWTNTSLCIPRKCYSKAALIAADLKGLMKGDVDSFISKISDVIIEWNCTKTYMKTKNNCQHFVDDILNHLGISLDYSGPLGVFLKQLRSSGTCALEWKPSEYARNKFKFLKSKFQFKSHSELDEVWIRIEKADPLFHEDKKLKEDIYIAKSFDRAFWLRYFSSKKKGIDTKLFAPSKKCPFGDPAMSSMVQEWF